MITVTKKKGRPTARYRMANGTEVQGLSRKADGRWKVSATGQTFVEPDEGRAVARFHAMTKKSPFMLAISSTATMPMSEAVEAVERFGQSPIKITLDENGKLVFSREADEDAMYRWMRDEILTRPELCAKRTGIEALGYLNQLKRPTASPKLTELGALYAGKTGLSSNEVSRSKLFWKEFVSALATVGVETVRELNHDAVHIYESKVEASKLSPKSILHRYRKIRTIFAYAIKRGKASEDCRKALDICAMLEVKEHTTLAPKPITPEQFWKIHSEVTKSGDTTFAAIMLTALNACMYPGEIACLKWDEVNLKAGELVTRRPKTGVSRVCMLWPEVTTALKKLPKQGDAIFHTKVRSYTVFSVGDKFEKYRDAAGVSDEVTFSAIRDAAFTSSCRSSSLDKARVLAGHRLPGATDHYVQRNPGFVKEACEAIRKQFYSNQ